ncbi:MAG: hypothetical protein NT012_03595 [Candidatus Nealsonbacteria bacterium]|nr:hypothetical protein [Candidatus Nealsonbacteria bacterium]
MEKFTSKYFNNLNKFVALTITIFVLISGFSFSTKSVKAAESDKAITAFTVPIQARTPLRDDFNSYIDGDLDGQGDWVKTSGLINVQATTTFEGAKAIKNSTGTTYYKKLGNLRSEGRITIYFKNPDTHTYIPFVLQEGNTERIVFGTWPTVDDQYIGYVNSTPEWVSIGSYTLNTWVSLEIEWHSTPSKQVRYRYNSGAWTDWMAPYTNWTNGVDTVAIKGDATLTDDISYVDFIAENLYTEETPTTSIATINESAKTIALNMPYGTDVTALVPTITIAGVSVSPTSSVAQNFTSPVTYTVTAANSSTQAYAVTVTVAAYTDKAITAFTVPDQVGTTTINESAKTIALTMPYGTVVTALVPTITIAGELVRPASLTQTDFTNPVTYTVTAADSLTQAYIVTVTVAANPAKVITAFTILDQVGTTTINESAKTIALAMPYGTVVTALVPTITITGASVSPLSGVANDFTTSSIYTVTAADASTQGYTVTVTVNPAPPTSGGGGRFYSYAKAITTFTIPNQVGTTTINESAKTIALTMPYGTVVTALVPIITIAGESVRPASLTPTDFTNPVTYTVTAANALTQDYTVTVNIALAIPTIGQETDWFIKEIKRTDIFRDGKIDVLDFDALVINWGKKGVDNPADVNQDGLVDILDFNALMVNWGKVESQS